MKRQYANEIVILLNVRIVPHRGVNIVMTMQPSYFSDRKVDYHLLRHLRGLPTRSRVWSHRRVLDGGRRSMHGIRLCHAACHSQIHSLSALLQSLDQQPDVGGAAGGLRERYATIIDTTICGCAYSLVKALKTFF